MFLLLCIGGDLQIFQCSFSQSYVSWRIIPHLVKNDDTANQSHREMIIGMSPRLRIAKRFSKILCKVLNALFFLLQLSSLFILDFFPLYFFPTPLFTSFIRGKSNQRLFNLSIALKTPKHEWIQDQIKLIKPSSDRNHLL